MILVEESSFVLVLVAVYHIAATEIDMAFPHCESSHVVVCNLNIFHVQLVVLSYTNDCTNFSSTIVGKDTIVNYYLNI